MKTVDSNERLDHQDGLQDQMLGIVVAAEEPATEEKRVNLVIESAKAKAQLKDLEYKILQLLSSSTGAGTLTIACLLLSRINFYIL